MPLTAWEDFLWWRKIKWNHAACVDRVTETETHGRKCDRAAVFTMSNEFIFFKHFSPGLWCISGDTVSPSCIADPAVTIMHRQKKCSTCCKAYRTATEREREECIRYTTRHEQRRYHTVLDSEAHLLWRSRRRRDVKAAPDGYDNRKPSHLLFSVPAGHPLISCVCCIEHNNTTASRVERQSTCASPFPWNGNYTFIYKYIYILWVHCFIVKASASVQKRGSFWSRILTHTIFFLTVQIMTLFSQGPARMKILISLSQVCFIHSKTT